jgi:hypothetical protein
MAANATAMSLATESFTSVENDDGRDEEEPEAVLVTNSVRIGSDPDQEVVQEDATCDGIPSGWRPGFTLLLDRGKGSEYGCGKDFSIEKIPPQLRSVK